MKNYGSITSIPGKKRYNLKGSSYLIPVPRFPLEDPMAGLLLSLRKVFKFAYSDAILQENNNGGREDLNSF